jgi:type VI secretion system secreted protein Hcp
MAVNYILELDGVKGESKFENYEDRGIDVDSFSWGVSNSAAAHTGGGASGGGIGQMTDINLSKHLDASSPTLVYYSYSGDHIAKGTLHVFESGGQTKVEYLKIDMTEIYIAAVSLSGHGSSNDKPMESVSLACSQLMLTYTVQAETGGAGLLPKVTIDAKKGKAST